MTIPGIGPVTAVALTALAPPAETFRRGRDFAAWLGLTPLQQSTGGKQRLGATSKMGERTLRRLLIIGASAVAALGRPARRSGGLVAGAHAGAQAADAGARWRWPTRWPASSGPCWPRGELSSSGRRPRKRVAAARPSGRGRSKERDGATVGETGSGKPALRQALQARGPDLDLIRELVWGFFCQPLFLRFLCLHRVRSDRHDRAHLVGSATTI